MANTTFQDMYKLFLNSIQDYKIKKLFSDETTVGIANDMLQTFLFKSIPKFYNCIKNISNIDTDNETFQVELDIDEKDILSDLMILKWIDWRISDITQMELTLDDTDFKHYSEDRNLSGKLKYRDELREITDQNMINYSLKHTPFKDWADGNYGL